LILTKKIEKEVTQYNFRIFKEFGFKIGEIANVDIEKWNKNSHEKILVMCDICKKTKKLSIREYYKSYEKYNTYCCSSKCAIFKNKLTNKDLYGDENYNNIEKIKKTCEEKYNCQNVFQLESVKELIKQTNIEKWGGIPMKNQKVLEKYKKTMIEKYGVDNISKLENIK